MLRELGIAASVAVALLVSWEAVSFAGQASADRAALVFLTTQRDAAIQAGNQNAAALTEANRKNDDVLRSAQAAEVDAKTRSATLATDLEEIRNAKENCTPADAALRRLR